MNKFHGPVPSQFWIREKGTDVWIGGNSSGKPFYYYIDAQRHLRTVVRWNVEQRDGRSYDNPMTKAEVIKECDRYEIIEMLLTPTSPSVQQPVFEQDRIDAYRDGFFTFDPSNAYIDPRKIPYASGIRRDWWKDGWYDASYENEEDDLLYPELRALI